MAAVLDKSRKIQRAARVSHGGHYTVNSVHLSFPSKAVEQWSGTFGSHVLFMFGQWWEGQEGLSKCVPMCMAMHVAL